MEEDEIVNCDLDVSVPFAKFETEELWPVLCGTAMWACDDHNRIKHWDSALKRCSQNFDGYSIVALSVDITMEGDDLGEMILNYDTPHRRNSAPGSDRTDCFNFTVHSFRNRRSRSHRFLIADSSQKSVTITDFTFIRCTFRNTNFNSTHFLDCTFSNIDFSDFVMRNTLVT
ncbi:hypothetical protein B0J11DRAFT_263671 [Dendryphion nanum]|uniref:Uncharacterized protein n=1 Tax=Dendryphion nanum TaxID=256645 RepID=A0A9P9DZR1_9PLEO|nr:hypothetical protein B0J11DRAFT_263671 [Dendryphion nanum]